MERALHFLHMGTDMLEKVPEYIHVCIHVYVFCIYHYRLKLKLQIQVLCEVYFDLNSNDSLIYLLSFFVSSSGNFAKH